MSNNAVKPRVGDKFIPYPLAMEAMEQVLYFAQEGIHEAGADIFTFTGLSGAGKTHIIRRIRARKEYQPYRGETGTVMMPLLYVEVTGAETPKSLAQRVLTELGDPNPARGRSQAIIQERAISLLKKKGCRFIIFDEVQQLISKKFTAADFFRQFSNQPVATVCLAGLPEVADMIKSNAQAGRRASPHVTIRPLNWFDGDERKMFFGVLKALQAQLPAPFNATPLTDEYLASCQHIVSGGLLGRLTQLLRFGCYYAQKAGEATISQRAFAEAADKMFELYNEVGTNAFRLQRLPATWKVAA